MRVVKPDHVTRIFTQRLAAEPSRVFPLLYPFPARLMDISGKKWASKESK